MYRMLRTCALLIAALSGCGGAAADPDAAARAFLTERNGGTPVAVGGDGPLVGTIERINGATLTLSSPLPGQPAQTVQLDDTTRVRRQAAAEASAITVGARLTAIGKLDGATLAADLVQLGADWPADGGALVIGAAGAGQGAANVAVAPREGDTVAAAVDLAHGTVSAVDGATLTLDGSDTGPISVEVGASTTIVQYRDVKAAELEQGMFVMVRGDRTSAPIKADTINIMPPPQRTAP